MAVALLLGLMHIRAPVWSKVAVHRHWMLGGILVVTPPSGICVGGIKLLRWHISTKVKSLLCCLNASIYISLTQHVICTLTDSARICSLIPLQTWHLPGGSFVSALGLFLILILIVLSHGSDLAPGPVCSLERQTTEGRKEKIAAWGPVSLGQQWDQSPVSPTPFLAPSQHIPSSQCV